MDNTVAMPRYRWSGRARWLRFLPAAAVVLATAAGMAWLLHLVFLGGFYLVMIAPILAALPVLGLLVGAVAWGHCRNPVVVGLLGLAAGLLVAPGHYQADIVDLAGWDFAHRVDVLPRYLVFRMNNDVMVDVARGDAGKQAGQGPDVVRTLFNWFFFAMETVVVSGLLMAVGIARSRKAYAEQQGRWMQSAAAQCPAGTGPLLAEALQDGRLDELAEMLTAPPAGAQHYCELTLEYCPRGHAAAPPDPAYLTVKEVTLKGGQGARKEKAVARQWRIEAEELALLAERFPNFALAHQQVTPEQPAALPATVSARADIQPIPEPFAGTVLTPGHLFVGTVISLLPLLLGLGIAGGLAAYGFGHRDELSTAEGCLVGGAAVGVFLLAFWYLTRYADFLPSRYLYRLSKQALARRPDALVEPDNPEAVYVQVIPRQNWGRVMVENATDVGFLWIDRGRGQVLFEGDRERWRIPAEALVSCAVEHFYLGGNEPNGANTFYLAVVRARVGDGVWEGPVTRRHIYWGKRRDPERKDEAHTLADAILELLPGA